VEIWEEPHIQARTAHFGHDTGPQNLVSWAEVQ